MEFDHPKSLKEKSSRELKKMWRIAFSLLAMVPVNAAILFLNQNINEAEALQPGSANELVLCNLEPALAQDIKPNEPFRNLLERDFKANKYHLSPAIAVAYKNDQQSMYTPARQEADPNVFNLTLDKSKPSNSDFDLSIQFDYSKDPILKRDNTALMIDLREVISSGQVIRNGTKVIIEDTSNVSGPKIIGQYTVTNETPRNIIVFPNYSTRINLKFNNHLAESVKLLVAYIETQDNYTLVSSMNKLHQQGSIFYLSNLASEVKDNPICTTPTSTPTLTPIPTPTPTITPTSTPAPEIRNGIPRKEKVLLVPMSNKSGEGSFSDSQIDDITKEIVRSYQYWKTNSLGRLEEIKIDVQKTTLKTDISLCDVQLPEALVRSRLLQQGFRLNDYTTVITLHYPTEGCEPFGASASNIITPKHVVINGIKVAIWRAISHEIGHTYEFNHTA